MDAGLPTTLNLALTAVLLPSWPDGHSLVSCLACPGIVKLHQPALELPDRMFGICEHCLRWHLLDCRRLGEALMVLLPDGDEFWRASRGDTWLTNGQ